MPRNQFSFYSTKDDLVEVLEAVGSKTSFCFANIDGNTEYVYKSALEIPEISTAIYGDLNREKVYLLIAPDTKPKTRQVELRRGGVSRFLDQQSHTESVMLKPGGVVGEFECIIAGQVGTISDNEWSIDLYKLLRAEFRKGFKKVKSDYVSKIAMEKLVSGVRLTWNIKSPTEYDLKF